jgi:hypothetical protein
MIERAEDFSLTLLICGALLLVSDVYGTDNQKQQEGEVEV